MTTETIRELKRMASEMDTFPFVPRTWNWLTHETGKHGNAAGGDAQIVAGCEGAEVYQDILQEGGSGSRTYVKNIIDLLILGQIGRGVAQQATARAAEFVALARLGLVDSTVSTPWLPPDAGDYYRVPEVAPLKPMTVFVLSDQPCPACTRCGVHRSRDGSQCRDMHTLESASRHLRNELRDHLRKPKSASLTEWFVQHARHVAHLALAESA